MPAARRGLRLTRFRTKRRGFDVRTSLRGGPAGGSLASNGTRFLRTACRTAAIVLEKIVKIFPSVVVGDFFPRFDTARCDDDDSAVAPDRLRIRSTGMIDVARQIPSRGAIDGPSAIYREHISRAARLAPLGFCGRDAPAAIGRDVAAALDRLRREQAKAASRASDTDQA